MRPEKAGSRKVRRLSRFCAVSLGVSSGALLRCTVHPAGYGSPGFLSMSRLTTLKPKVGVSGQRFGRLTATEPAGRAASGHARWLFACECGRSAVLLLTNVRTGNTTSCGCLTKRHGVESGQRFERLLAIRPERMATGRSGWRCRCDCGAEVVVDRGHLTLGRTRSCGCLHREQTAAMNRRADGVRFGTTEYNRMTQRKRKADPVKAMRDRLSRRMSEVLRKLRTAKREPTLTLLGYTATDLHRHLERQFLPGMTWQNRAQWHIDHIVPMSTASTIEDVVRLNQLPNLRPMWAGENLRKRDQRTHLV